MLNFHALQGYFQDMKEAGQDVYLLGVCSKQNDPDLFAIFLNETLGEIAMVDVRTVGVTKLPVLLLDDEVEVEVIQMVSLLTPMPLQETWHMYKAFKAGRNNALGENNILYNNMMMRRALVPGVTLSNIWYITTNSLYCFPNEMLSWPMSQCEACRVIEDFDSLASMEMDPVNHSDEAYIWLALTGEKGLRCGEELSLHSTLVEHVTLDQDRKQAQDQE